MCRLYSRIEVAGGGRPLAQANKLQRYTYYFSLCLWRFFVLRIGVTMLTPQKYRIARHIL